MLKKASVEPLDRSNENGRNVYRRKDVEHVLNMVPSEAALANEETEVI